MRMVYPWTQGNWKTLYSGSANFGGALLVAGPRGVGKRTFARTLAQGLLCTDPIDAQPCGVCMSCRLFLADSHPDFRLVEPEPNAERGEATDTAEAVESSDTSVSAAASRKDDIRAIRVDQVRELADFLALSSQLGGTKVVLIQPADRLHPSASAALLKTLEEPPAATVFILVTDRPQRLAPTLRSRCFRVDFAVPARETALEWLTTQGVEDPEIALAQAGFAPLSAAAMEQNGFSVRRRALSNLLLSGEGGAPALAASVDPTELPLFCQLLQRWCYDLLSLRLAGRVRYNPDYAEKLRTLADNAEVHQLTAMMNELLATARTLEHPLNARLVIEQLAIRYSRTISGQAP